MLLQGHFKDGLYRLEPASKSAVDNKFAHPLACVSIPSVSYLSSCTSDKNCTSQQCNRQCSFGHELSKSGNVTQIKPRTIVCKQWHDRLGHHSLHVLRLVLNKIGVPCSINDMSFCDTCKVGKLSQLPFSRHDITVKASLELVYLDLWGLAPVLSTEGFRYYVIFVYAFLVIHGSILSN